MSIATTTKSVTAENQFSGAVDIQGSFNVSVGGAGWAGTIHVQRSFDGGATWLDVDSFTVPTQRVGDEPELGVKYRIGCKTGNFSSGTIPCRISR